MTSSLTWTAIYRSVAVHKTLERPLGRLLKCRALPIYRVSRTVVQRNGVFLSPFTEITVNHGNQPARAAIGFGIRNLLANASSVPPLYVTS